MYFKIRYMGKLIIVPLLAMSFEILAQSGLSGAIGENMDSNPYNKMILYPGIE